MNKTYLTTNIGRLRLIGLLEGISFLLLVLIGVPLKYGMDSPAFVKILGPIHGALFLIFILATITTSIEWRWSFMKITWKVLLASIVPFGTFYVDAKILRAMHETQKS